VIGDYDRPKVRLPGGGGAPEIAAMAKEVIVIIRQSQRTFVERIHFRSSVPGSGAMVVITDLGVLRLDPDARELVLTRVHPGVSVDQVRSETGWDLRVADELVETEPPRAEELRVLRELRSALEETAV
jgi:glutaconate CoA-transferase subunit B